MGSIPGSGKSPGGGNSNPLRYSCLTKSHGQRSLASFSPWGRSESNRTEPIGTRVLFGGRCRGFSAHTHHAEGDAARGRWQALRGWCPCRPSGASWEPRTAVCVCWGGAGGRAGETQDASGLVCARVHGTVGTVGLSRSPDPDGAAAQVRDRAPPQQDPAARQAPRALRVPGAGRAVVGRHAGAAPRVPQGADADRQDPGPHGQRALRVHRAQEEVGVRPRGRPTLPGGRLRELRAVGTGRPRLAGRLLPPQLPQRSPFPGFLSPGIPLSEMGAPSLSDAEPWLPLPSVLVLPSPPVSSPPSACWMLISFPPAALSLLSSWPPRPLLPKGEACSVRPALICVSLCPPLYWIRLPVGGPCAPVPGGAPSLHPAAPHRWGCRPTSAGLIALQTFILIPVSGPGQDRSFTSHSPHLPPYSLFLLDKLDVSKAPPPSSRPRSGPSRQR